jgi:hypothetical protein
LVRSRAPRPEPRALGELLVRRVLSMSRPEAAGRVCLSSQGGPPRAAGPWRAPETGLTVCSL